MTDQLLSHLRVLDLSRLQPGAFCTGVLADLGADVLRVEPPKGGDPLRMLPGAPAAYHRGKRAMTLDLKHPRAPDVLRRLIADVDVVVESGLPAALREQPPPRFHHAGERSEQPRVVADPMEGRVREQNVDRLGER